MATILKFKEVIPSEYEECKLFWDWCQLNFLIKKVTAHIVNEGRRSFSQGSKLKKIGLRKGVSDYFIGLPRGGYYGVWIEMKIKNRKRARVSPDQIEWVSLMRCAGFYAFVSYGGDEAIQFMKDYIGGRIIKES